MKPHFTTQCNKQQAPQAAPTWQNNERKVTTKKSKKTSVSKATHM
jgi:hypothetical protein